MKTTAGQALRFAACARAPMRQARCAGTALNHNAAGREAHRPPARRPGRSRRWKAPLPASPGHGCALSCPGYPCRWSRVPARAGRSPSPTNVRDTSCTRRAHTSSGNRPGSGPGLSIIASVANSLTAKRAPRPKVPAHNAAVIPPPENRLQDACAQNGEICVRGAALTQI